MKTVQERLREYAAGFFTREAETIREAADEIDRLTAELNSERDAASMYAERSARFAAQADALKRERDGWEAMYADEFGKTLEFEVQIEDRTHERDEARAEVAALKTTKP